MCCWIPINEASSVQRFPRRQLLWAWRVLFSVRLVAQAINSTQKPVVGHSETDPESAMREQVGRVLAAAEVLPRVALLLQGDQLGGDRLFQVAGRCIRNRSIETLNQGVSPGGLFVPG